LSAEPEPASLWLLAVGLLAIMLVSRSQMLPLLSDRLPLGAAYRHMADPGLEWVALD
jgi:hypothetical protein